MRKLEPIPKVLLDSWDNLENLDFSEVFMIVDMQSYFISNPEEKNLAKWYIDYYNQLKNNIIKQIEKTLSNSWMIIKVEYRWKDDTIEEINKVLGYNKDRLITLTKDSMGLVSDYNEYGESLKIEDTLDAIKKRSVVVKVWWIHTSKCVHGTSRNLYHAGIETKILLWTTLNLHSDQDYLDQENQLSYVRSNYKGLSHLLDYWNKPVNLPWLSDYL